MNKFKKFIALALTLAMTMSVAVTAASAAYDFSADVYADNAPDKLTEVDENILSGATAAANTTALSFLGINVTSTDSAGALNSASNAASPMDLLVFGSDLNESPDPYLWNFYSNLKKNGYPGDKYDKTTYCEAGWHGAYTILNDAKSGPTGNAATVDETKVFDICIKPTCDGNWICKTCDPMFFYEPDVLFGGNDDENGTYSVGLDYYWSKINPQYNPLVLYGWTTDGYASRGNGFESTAAMANGVYSMAKDIKDTYGSTKVSRYNNGDVLQCGIDYSNFALGVYYYVQSRLNPNNSLVSSIPMAGYCTGVSISDTGAITVTNDNSLGYRYEQYLDGIAYQVETGTTYKDYGALKDEVKLIIMDTNQLTDSQKRLIAQVNVKYVDIDSVMPQTAYGTTMQSADNILGVPYFVGLLYEGRLSNNKESLSEYDYTAYFIENLYHVNNGDVETVLDAMVGDGCGSGYTGLDRSYNYNDLINSMIRIGAVYYEQTSMGSGNWLAIDKGDFYVAYEAVN